MLPWILCGILGLAAAILLARLCGIRRDLSSLTEQLETRLSEDTNNVLYLKSGDRGVRRLTATLTGQLRALREQQLQYINGDRRLKEAVANISHDLRTPLTAISGYLELLEAEPLTPVARRQLGIIADRTAHMRQLTEELFRYSLILSDEDSGIQETVSVTELLEESIAGYYAVLCQRGITPEITLPEKRVSCVCSRSALARVFSNLLNNAVKYSDGDLRIAMTEDGCITFANRAAGLTQTQLAQLFERYYTVESAQHSTGLGLAIARTVTEQMGGSIAADYHDDTLCITVRLPVAP